MATAIKATSFRLGADTLKKLAALAKAQRISQRAVVEALVRAADMPK